MRPLIEKQLEVAFECLCIGGNFLIKIFTFFESETILLLARICFAFEQVKCLKPPSSKPGNSEVLGKFRGFGEIQLLFFYYLKITILNKALLNTDIFAMS